jgi:hypothetical protein
VLEAMEVAAAGACKCLLNFAVTTEQETEINK